MTYAQFIALSTDAQLDHVAHQGRVLPARWETTRYVASYQMPDELRVELSYHLPSGVFAAVHAYSARS